MFLVVSLPLLSLIRAFSFFLMQHNLARPGQCEHMTHSPEFSRVDVTSCLMRKAQVPFPVRGCLSTGFFANYLVLLSHHAVISERVR